jgi:hypothetical protein
LKDTTQAYQGKAAPAEALGWILLFLTENVKEKVSYVHITAIPVLWGTIMDAIML